MIPTGARTPARQECENEFHTVPVSAKETVAEIRNLRNLKSETAKEDASQYLNTLTGPLRSTVQRHYFAIVNVRTRYRSPKQCRQPFWATLAEFSLTFAFQWIADIVYSDEAKQGKAT